MIIESAAPRYTALINTRAQPGIYLDCPPRFCRWVPVSTSPGEKVRTHEVEDPNIIAEIRNLKPIVQDVRRSRLTSSAYLKTHSGIATQIKTDLWKLAVLKYLAVISRSRQHKDRHQFDYHTSAYTSYAAETQLLKRESIGCKKELAMLRVASNHPVVVEAGDVYVQPKDCNTADDDCKA